MPEKRLRYHPFVASSFLDPLREDDEQENSADGVSLERPLAVIDGQKAVKSSGEVSGANVSASEHDELLVHDRRNGLFYR